jgi:hypothetical protein
MLGFFARVARSVRPARRPGRQAGFRPEVEGLGGTRNGSGRRLPMRPEVEQLEERRLMSTSGVISAITDNRGQTVVFEVSGNGQVYELNPAVNSNWFQMANWDTAGFRQVSAGLDAYGRAVCYALHNGDNHVWEMDNYHTTGFSSQGTDLGWDATQISATRNNECFAIRPRSPSDWVSLYNRASGSLANWVLPWGGLRQISTGVDSSGRDEVYFLNTAQHVYRIDNGTYWVLPFQATQISAGVGWNWTDIDLFYIDTTANHEVYHYDGSSSRAVAFYASQISAAVDQYGNEFVYNIDMYYHWVYRNDLSGNLNGVYVGGSVSQISAAGNGMVFGVASWDNSVWVYDPNWNWYGYWASTGNWSSDGWHPLYGTASSPYYFPLAA